ncbi:DUF2804 domain-containing protein [Indiicoccus explosivorum]|uniref:DUF2804 domain-containing protein n=1 Tax=Indiicoccus explosivorum TaxID=1917864 RepID=UPI000B4383D9|nr:DUF2804 domain-containing protein [Indiicoccus explosivorum]
MQHLEREITDPVRLCNEKGQLNPEAIGFARQPLIESNLRGHFLRKKRWNHWCVFGPEISFSMTVSHFDYAVACSVYFLNYDNQRFHEKSIVLPFPKSMRIGSKAFESCHFSHEGLAIELKDSDGKTEMSIEADDFDNETLHAELEIRHPDSCDSLNVVIPRSRNLFQLTGKYPSLPVKGSVRIGDRKYEFDPYDSFAFLDCSRGIWPRETARNWAIASQRVDGRIIGLNFGGKWTDGTGMTENAFFVDGEMVKIHEDVFFNYSRTDYTVPWEIRTKFSDDVRLDFFPFFERAAKSNLRLLKSEIHQVYGYFKGYVRYPDGRKLNIRQLLGSAEDYYAKW